MQSSASRRDAQRIRYRRLILARRSRVQCGHFEQGAKRSQRSTQLVTDVRGELALSRERSVESSQQIIELSDRHFELERLTGQGQARRKLAVVDLFDLGRQAGQRASHAREHP